MRIISGYDSKKVVEEVKDFKERRKKTFGLEYNNIQYQMINIDGKPFYSVLIY